MSARKLSKRLPVKHVLCYLNGEDTRQPHPPADFPRTSPSRLTAPRTARAKVPEEVLGYLSLAGCKAEPYAGHLHQLRTKPSSAEYTQQ